MAGKKTAPDALLKAGQDTKIQKGEVKNPWGRKGKDGTGGVSLKNEFKAFLNRLSQEERDAVWTGLFTKAMLGDVPALKMWVELNGERVTDDIQLEQGSQTKIIINIPQSEE